MLKRPSSPVSPDANTLSAKKERSCSIMLIVAFCIPTPVSLLISHPSNVIIEPDSTGRRGAVCRLRPHDTKSDAVGCTYPFS